MNLSGQRPRTADTDGTTDPRTNTGRISGITGRSVGGSAMTQASVAIVLASASAANPRGVVHDDLLLAANALVMLDRRFQVHGPSGCQTAEADLQATREVREASRK